MDDNNYIEQIASLKEEVHRLKTVIANLPGSIYWKDKDGVYLGRNSYAMEKMQSVNLEGQKEQDDIVGKTDFDLFPQEVANNYRKTDLEAMSTQSEVSREESTILPDGSTIVQLSRKRPLYDLNKEVIGVIGNTVDITNLKKIEDDLRKAKNDAEQADIIKTEFIRNMEHDLRTPFSGILGMSEILASQEKNAEKKEALEDIVASARSLYQYCNEIIEYSRLETGRLVIVDKKFSLNDIVLSIIDSERPAIVLKGLDIKVSLDKQIPSVLIGDKRRIHRILLNLIGNAIKFTEVGSITVTTHLIKQQRKEAVIQLMVEDTGIGIPDAQKDLVFERFSRLSLSNKGLYDGLGVGLRIVRQFVHDLDGEIDLISQLGKGTKFICTLPVALPLVNNSIKYGLS